MTRLIPMLLMKSFVADGWLRGLLQPLDEFGVDYVTAELFWDP